jgi:hypothetical protein
MEQVDALTRREIDQIISVNVKKNEETVSVSKEDEEKIQKALERRFKK